MSCTPHSMLNQSLFEDQADHILMMPSQQLGNFLFHTPLPLMGFNNIQPLKTFDQTIPPSSESYLHQPMATNQNEDLKAHSRESHQILSMKSSSTNYWAWGEMKRNEDGDHEHLGVCGMKMKKMKKTRRKVRDPRFCFKTMSDVDVLDDGYKWRKYGQKVVKNTQHPRSYYRCTQDNCRVKKRVERLAEDPRMVITTYEGRHIHSPSHDNEDQDSRVSAQINNLFW